MRRTRFHSLICVWAAATTATGGCRTPPTATRPGPAPLVATAPVLAAPSGSGARATVPLDETVLAGAITGGRPERWDGTTARRVVDAMESHRR